MKKSTKKGLSQIIAEVLMLSVTISLISIAYVFFSHSTSTAADWDESQTNNAIDTMVTKISIVSVNNDKVYIRNTGSVDIPNNSIGLYINGVNINYTMDGILAKGSIAALNITTLLPGSYKIRATARQTESSFFTTIE